LHVARIAAAAAATTFSIVGLHHALMFHSRFMFHVTSLHGSGTTVATTGRATCFGFLSLVGRLCGLGQTNRPYRDRDSERKTQSKSFNAFHFYFSFKNEISAVSV
jgi:hypothetical protein